MNRLTKKTKEGRVTAYGHSEEERLERLWRYEEIEEQLLADQQNIEEEMEKLRAQGKVKSVHYQQLLANKMVNIRLLTRFSAYDL